MNKDEIKNKLNEEYKKLEEDFDKEEYEYRIINNNRFEQKFITFFGCFSFPFMVSFLLTVFGGHSVLTNIISPQLIPVVLFGTSLGIGAIGNSILEKKLYKFKTKLKDITNAKEETELLEESMRHKLNYSISFNKMRALRTINEKLDKNAMIRCASNLNSNLTIDEINKKIVDLENELNEAFNELAVATKRKTLANEFWKSRDILAPISDAIIFPAMAGATLMATWNLPISMPGAIPSALELLLPVPLASIVGIGYVIKRTKDNKKIYKKLNAELGDNSLPKKRKYLEDEELRNELQEKINKVCFIGEELIKHQELLDLRNNSLKEDFWKKQNNKEKEVSAIKKLVDGEPINKDPLTNIPEPVMSLYGISGSCFDTQDELKAFCEKNNYSLENTYVLDYLGSVAGKSDVIRKTNHDGKTILYSAADEDGYGTYNHERSVYRGEYIWEYNYGQIRSLYKLFRDRGIVFNNDVYAKIDEFYKNLYDMMGDNELFGYKSVNEKEQTSNKVKKLSKDNNPKK